MTVTDEAREDVWAALGDALLALNAEQPRDARGRFAGGASAVKVEDVEIDSESMFTEQGQDEEKLQAIRDAIPEGGPYPAGVALEKEDGDLEILDGHHRATVAEERGDKMPMAIIDKAKYRELRAAGFGDQEVAHAVLTAAGRISEATQVHAKLGAGKALDKALKHLTANDGCGTGPGGFQPGNTCALGGGGKSKFAGATVDATVHAHAESVKNRVAALVGGIPEELTEDAGQKDKKPYDVKVPGGRGKPDQDIEVKSMSVGAKQAISVHDDALLRKVDHAERTGNGFHTVVVDDRDTFNGGANKENYSGHGMYYKRGSGRYSLSQMHPVKDSAELRKLIKMKDEDLPEKARGGLPPPPPVEKLREAAAKASESRKARDKARKERNRDKLREQARARAQRKKEAVE